MNFTHTNARWTSNNDSTDGYEREIIPKDRRNIIKTLKDDNYCLRRQIEDIKRAHREEKENMVRTHASVMKAERSQYESRIQALDHRHRREASELKKRIRKLEERLGNVGFTPVHTMDRTLIIETKQLKEA